MTPPCQITARDGGVRFAVPLRAVRLVAGSHARSKIVEIDGMTVEDARRILAIAPG